MAEIAIRSIVRSITLQYRYRDADDRGAMHKSAHFTPNAPQTSPAWLWPTGFFDVILSRGSTKPQHTIRPSKIREAPRYQN
jgi:hypothetical protein